MKVLDTTVAVDYLRGRDEAVGLLEELVANDEVVASELVRFELLTGARPRELPVLESFFSALAWVPVDASVATRGAELARQFRKAYSGIDDADYLIAATADLLNAELLTTNVRHFPMVAGLRPAY